MGEAGGHFAHGGQACEVVEPRLGLARGLFRLAAPRDVVQEADKAARIALLHLAHGEHRREYRAVAAACRNLAADADDFGFASVQEALEVAVVTGAVGAFHEQRDVFAHHFSGRPAEQAFGRAIEGFDDAVLVDEDDGLHSGIEYRLEVQPGTKTFGHPG